MQYLDLTLPTPEENLALDEALLDEAEAAGQPRETLRIWRPSTPLVVLGLSSKFAEETHGDACRRDGVPILRRPSGGAAILTGPGCLMYSVVLSYQRQPAIRAVDMAHQFVLGTIAAALRAEAPDVRQEGISDLALGVRKFSGNSLRCKQTHLLYHGTLLYAFPLELVERYLAMPPRQPAYRQGRPHGSFVTNLPLPPGTIGTALRQAWVATHPREDWPRRLVAELVATRYSRPEWNQRR